MELVNVRFILNKCSIPFVSIVILRLSIPFKCFNVKHNGFTANLKLIQSSVSLTLNVLNISFCRTIDRWEDFASFKDINFTNIIINNNN